MVKYKRNRTTARVQRGAGFFDWISSLTGKKTEETPYDPDMNTSGEAAPNTTLYTNPQEGAKAARAEYRNWTTKHKNANTLKLRVPGRRNANIQRLQTNLAALNAAPPAPAPVTSYNQTPYYRAPSGKSVLTGPLEYGGGRRKTRRSRRAKRKATHRRR